MNKLLGFFIAVTALALPTRAVTWSLLPDGNEVVFFKTFPIGGVAEEANYIEANYSPWEVWPFAKFEFEGTGIWSVPDTSLLADHVPTVPLNDLKTKGIVTITPTHPIDGVYIATITYDFTAYLPNPDRLGLRYILVKDGRSANKDEGHYYALYKLNGDYIVKGTISVRANEGATKAISHVSFFLPDGGSTAILLGLGFLGAALFRRKLS